MNPSLVGPCYVYHFQKFSPALKIPLAAALQERLFFVCVCCGRGVGGRGKGNILRKFRDFAAVKSPRFLPILCPRPKPRDIDNSKTFNHDAMKNWISAYMYKYPFIHAVFDTD